MWSFRDLVAMRMVVELRNAGLRLQELRKVSARLRDYRGDFAGTFLVAADDHVAIVTSAELASALKAPGQMVFKIIFYDLERAEREVHKALAAETEMCWEVASMLMRES